jgi:hypothetical protein
MKCLCWNINFDEWLYHQYGEIDECTASAKVFAGEFCYFGYSKTFIVPHDYLFEEPYMFTSDQTMKSLGDPTSSGIKNFEHSFVVFCTLCVIVDFLVCLLRQATISQNENPEAIHGVWSQLKDTSPFCVEFG